MKTHEILRRAIPDGKCDEAGKKLGVGGDTVRRWRREPESDDAPLSSGRANPLDRVEDLIDVVLLINPASAHTVAEYPRDYYRERAESMALVGTVKGAAAAALADMVRAVNAINLDAPVNEVETKMMAAEEKFNEVKRHVRKTYADRNGDKVTVYAPARHLDNAG